MIRLAIRKANYGAAMHVGGDVEWSTYIVEVENEKLERLLKPEQYTTISISEVSEEEDGE